MRRRRLVLLGAVIAIVALILILSLNVFGGNDDGGSADPGGQGKAGSASASGKNSDKDGDKDASGDPESEQATTTTEPQITMQVAPIPSTMPSAFDFSTGVYRDGERLNDWVRTEPISFGPGKDYTSLEGIITFRGNNYREGASYGKADIREGRLEVLWTAPSGSITRGSGTGAWTGSGWTGQPLIVRWPSDLKSIMNIKDEKKTDPGLVEVIYPCLDGNIYFLDLRDGTKTRETIVSGGGAFKGTGSIYPEGPPILCIGHGDGSPNKDSVRARLYSLVDQSLLYSFGMKPDPISFRKWHAYDSSALFDVATDTIIEPGENGVFYTIKLNTRFDKAAGTLSVDPDIPIKMRYTAPNYNEGADNTPSTRWWGVEASPAVWKNYLYVPDNGGKMMCIDLNTLKAVWVQDVLDDTNTTPIFEESLEDNTCYIYMSTSLHITAKSGPNGRTGDIPIWKIDAATGEIVWEAGPYPCYTISGVSGGVQGTPVLGKNDIADLVIYPVARTPDPNSGVLVALDKQTGREVWSLSMPNYAWSSPVAVYTPEGKSYIVQCDSVGIMRLIEGRTGVVIDTLDLGSNTEASPAVFGDTIVVGTRGQQIYGIKIK